MKRNALCSCGSGKKYKNCCYRKSEASEVAASGALGAGMPTPDERRRLLALYAERNYADLERLARQLLGQYPRAVGVWKLLGAALINSGRPAEALRPLEMAATLSPNDSETYNNLGVLLKQLARPEDAEAKLRKALEISPTFSEAHYNLGNVLIDLGRFDDAIKSFCRASETKPDYIEAYVRAAELHMELGNFLDSEQCINQALRLDPNHVTALSLIVALKKMTIEDSAWKEKAERLIMGRLPAKDETRLSYALGKFYDDIRQYELAFKYYLRANQLQRQIEGPFDPDRFDRFVNDLIAIFNGDFMTKTSATSRNDSERPVFIIGMPRTGTSLLEQMLASHPDVFGAGELTFWQSKLERHMSSLMRGELGQAHLKEIGEDAEAELSRHSERALRVVDKMPSNFLFVGLIHAAFPRARFIHMRRDPLDTCLSIYFQQFSASHPYATDLNDLGFFYRQYHRLMAHWRTVIPADNLMELSYEALLEDQEGTYRRVLRFIGVDPDALRTDFYRARRRVFTPSFWQVRQEIYKTSVRRWRHYEQCITPLLPLMELQASST